MNPLFDWLIKSSLSITLLYSVFKLAVSRDRAFAVNRFVLLGILVVSAILPLLHIPVFEEAIVVPKMDVIREFISKPLNSDVTLTPALTPSITPSITPTITSTVQAPLPVQESMHINWWLVLYLLAVIVLFVRILISVFRVFQIIQKADKQPFQKLILAVVKDIIQPFTFLHHIIISEKDYTENRDIVIAHEYAHIKYLHAIDLFVCELFTAMHWFNPLMWMLRRDLKLVHEYQADQAVLSKGIDEKKYQLLVLEKAVGERRFAMANHFKQKPILKRIKMMKKKGRNQWTGIKLLLLVPVLFLLLQAFTYSGAKSKKNELNGTYRFEIEETITNGVKRQVVYDPNTCGLKTWSDEYFLWVNSSPRGLNTGGSLGGGTYKLKGNKYIETFEHHASPSFRGVTMRIHLELKNDTIIEIWPVDKDFNYDKDNCTIQKYVRVD